MQRRVAAIYFVFFLVLGASAYSVIALAEEPTVEVSGETYESNDTFALGGQQYTVTGLQAAEAEGDGHGGGGGIEYSGQLTWTNESFQYTDALGNNSTVPFRDGTYRVAIPNESDPAEFTLTQEFNVSQRLAEDPEVENQTITREDGQQYVVYTNGSTQPLSAYLPAPDTATIEEGSTFDYAGNETTVGNVTQAEAPVSWVAPNDLSAELGQASNVTVGDETFLVIFDHDGNAVTLTQDFAGYNEGVARQDYFHERVNGLWGVVILSLLGGILIVMLAYMPVRG